MIKSSRLSCYIILATNCGSLSNIMLLGRLYNFHILFLNNCANSSTDVFSIVGIKYTILVN